jgi:hypothetical protein
MTLLAAIPSADDRYGAPHGRERSPTPQITIAARIIL